MKEKIISFILGVVIGMWWVISYNHFTKPAFPAWGMGWNFWWQMEMTTERWEQMAERLWMTQEELQKELDNGKDIRTLMQENWISRWNGQPDRVNQPQ